MLSECLKENRMFISIDQAIYESEKEIENGAEAIDAEKVFTELERKHLGEIQDKN